MEHSESIAKIAPAMAKAWGDTPAPKKNSTVKVYSPKGSYTFNYADFGEIMKTINPPFKANGLFVMQDVQTVRDPDTGRATLSVTTKVFHSSGEWMSGGHLEVQTENDMQKMGGQMTYLRRYSLSSFLGLATEQDDDGNSPEALTGYTNQTEQPGNSQNGTSKGRNTSKGSQQGQGNKNAAGKQQGTKNDEPKKEEPAPMTAAQKASLDKQMKNLSNELMMKEEDVWKRVQLHYTKPGKSPVPERDKLTQKWADGLIGLLDKHVAGEPLAELPKQGPKQEGAEQDGKAESVPK